MAKRKGLTCVLFRETPDWTNFKAGSYSWIPTGDAEHYIAGGYGVEYDPVKGEVEQREEPTMDNTKDEILKYLKAECIPHKKSSTKSELLDLI